MYNLINSINTKLSSSLNYKYTILNVAIRGQYRINIQSLSSVSHLSNFKKAHPAF